MKSAKKSGRKLYLPKKKPSTDISEEEKEKIFRNQIDQKGMQVVETIGDGNCLFRSVS